MAKARLKRNLPSVNARRRRIRSSVRREVSKVLTKNVNEHRRIVKDWSDYNKPTFRKDIRVGLTEQPMFFGVTLEANNARNAPGSRAPDPDISVYELLRDGTDVNYARMTRDFQRKSFPNSLRTSPGRGGFSHLGAPRGGIDARNWDVLINKKLDSKLRKGVRGGLRKGLRKISSG